MGKINFLLVVYTLTLVVNFVNILAISRGEYEYGIGTWVGFCMSLVGILMAGTAIYQYHQVKNSIR